MITAPSTSNPKSNAPKLIRFPLTPNKFIKIKANNMESGITDATTSPARRFPKKRIKTKMTIKAPSNKLVATVLIALFTILVLSRKGSTTTPSGRDFCISLILFFTPSITFLLFSPFSIITTAPATSPWAL